MAKKSVSRSTIIKKFQDYVLENGHSPQTVRLFTKFAAISDDNFYTHFGSITTVESTIWEDYFHQTLKVVMNDPEFEEMEPRDKHLSFLFTLIEVVRKDRAYIQFKLERVHPPQFPKELVRTQRLVTDAEIAWAKSFAFLPEKTENLTQSAYRNVLWSHAVATLVFWAKDDSAGGTDTDIFIEKTTRTAFDIGELPAFDSIVDLGKFFLQRMGFAKTTA